MTVHRVSTTDTLPILAARYYGSANRWREIAVANDLRPPYISEQPLDQYGALLASYPITVAIAAGALSFPLAGASVGFVRTGARVVLQQQIASGMNWSDVAIVASYDSAAITLEQPLANSYSVGVALLVFEPVGELRGAVAKPGDTLIIPGDTDNAAQILTAEDRFGRDLAVDDGGRLLLDAQGDIAVTSGKANLLQQLRNRLRCERGTMPRHPSYGCTAQSYIGEASAATLPTLLQSALALALSEDPRVGSVEQVGVVFVNDLVDVSARVVAKNEAIDLSLVVGR